MHTNSITKASLPKNNNLKPIPRRSDTRQNKELRMIFTRDAFKGIKSSVGSERPETGGILLGFRTDYIVRKFIFDKKGIFSPGGYDPNVEYLNPFLKNEWHDNGYELIGFVHSHPRGLARLSGDWGNGIGDLGYLKTIFDHIKGIDKFLVPIVHSAFDGNPFKIFPFIAWRDSVEKYQKGQISIVKDDTPPMGKLGKREVS